jgi:putative NADH-flavin reductase
MKIAIIGATGNVGKRLLQEALRRQYTVTAIARCITQHALPPKVHTHAVDVHDGFALSAVLQQHAVISSTPFGSVLAEHIITPVKNAGVKRLLVVGGAGSLEIAPSLALVDTSDFPEEHLAPARAGRVFLEDLYKERELDWTFLSPSAWFIPGARTTQFRLGKNQLLIAADGKSWISMEDFSVAMFDELENPSHIRQRFTVGY